MGREDELLKDIGVGSWDEGDKGALGLLRRYGEAKQEWDWSPARPSPTHASAPHVLYLLSSKTWLVSVA